MRPAIILQNDVNITKHVITIKRDGVRPIVLGHPSVLHVVVPAQRVLVQHAVGSQVGEYAAGHPGCSIDT